MGKQKWSVIVTVALIVIALFASRKTIKLWTMDQTERQQLLQTDPDAYKDLIAGSMRLGLDLQGGIHTVVRAKVESLPKKERADAVNRVKEIIRNRVDPEGVFEPIIQTQGEDRIIIDLPGWKDEKRAEQLIKGTARLEFKMVATQETADQIIKRIDSVVVAVNKRKSGADGGATDGAESAGDSTTPAAQNEPDTTGENLLSELLGSDSTATDTALDNEPTPEEEAPFSSTFLYRNNVSRINVPWPIVTIPVSEKKTVQKILKMPEVQRVIPKGIQILFSTRDDVQDNQEIFRIYFLKDEVRFLGKDLENIRASRDQTGSSVVNFQLSGRPANKFASLTSNNIDKPFAIVLDDKVESAPFINSRIRTRGQITLGGSADAQDAKDLETVLKAGALPVDVEIIEKNLVGPTLGSDSIHKGYKSSLWGLMVVLLFIGIYYRLSGVIADVALIFNMFFLLAIMAGLGATLTMPGIAGIILTLGIAVDANVLIFERIREEMAAGKNVRSAIDAGYERALLAIVDSHVTTMITAAALFWFGSGPIRGFAVTLFWGVLISLLTAWFITRMFFNLRKNYKTLSI